MEKHRCGWCKGDELYEAYHDKEWGVPVKDDAIAIPVKWRSNNKLPEKPFSIRPMRTFTSVSGSAGQNMVVQLGLEKIASLTSFPTLR